MIDVRSRLTADNRAGPAISIWAGTGGDGVWTYDYDAENRLFRATIKSAAVTGGFPNRKLEFAYDYAGRRVQKTVFAWSGSAWTVSSARRFIYDGWNLIAEYDAPSGTSFGSIKRSYTWGLDIRGSLGATGGVGALLQLKDHASGDAYFPAHDGNGNVMALYDSSTGSAVATYEYSPFGELLRAEGAYARENPFRFSSKFTDDDTGLVYYGYRYYSPTLGRFINRDPIGESGGNNLYGFAGNDSVNSFDYLGLDTDADRGVAGKLEGLPVPNMPGWMTERYDGLSSWQQAFDEAFDLQRRDVAIRAGQAHSQRQWDEQVTLGRKIDQRLVYRCSDVARSANRATGTEAGRISNSADIILRQPEYATSTVTGRVVRVGGYPGYPGDPVFVENVEGAVLIIGGLLPYVGDGLDIVVLLNPASTSLDRKIAGASLGINILTGGILPNAGPITQGARKVLKIAGEGGTSRVIVIRNGHLAGKVHPKTGIPFDADGFPDFSGVEVGRVTIQQTGNRAADFAAANRAAGLAETPRGYTWHHHQDGKTMQLVPTDIHRATGHTGGVATGGGG